METSLRRLSRAEAASPALPRPQTPPELRASQEADNIRWAEHAQRQPIRHARVQSAQHYQEYVAEYEATHEDYMQIHQAISRTERCSPRLILDICLGDSSCVPAYNCVLLLVNAHLPGECHGCMMQMSRATTSLLALILPDGCQGIMKPCQGLEFSRLIACMVLGQVHMKDVDEGYMAIKTGQEETW